MSATQVYKNLGKSRMWPTAAGFTSARISRRRATLTARLSDVMPSAERAEILRPVVIPGGDVVDIGRFSAAHAAAVDAYVLARVPIALEYPKPDRGPVGREPIASVTANPSRHAVALSWCLVPGAWCLVPGAWCLVPGAWCPVPVPVPGARCPVPVPVPVPVPGAWCLGAGAWCWCLVPGVWCPVPGAWCLVPRERAGHGVGV